MVKNLSKSKYLSGLQCEKRLWLEFNDSDKATPVSAAQQRILDQGTEVGILARERFPGGVLIKFDRSNLPKGVSETKDAINSGNSIIFEGTFFFDDTYALADIIKKNKDGTWDIIEVKSSTGVKEVYIPDLALQKYVLQGSGLKINRTNLMHIKKDCVYPDLSNVFVIADLTAEVDCLIQNISTDLQSFKTIVSQGKEPEVPIGPQCRKPYECPFKDYCWEFVGNRAVFDIPRLADTKQLELRESGIFTIDKLPPDFPISENQRAYVERTLNRTKDTDHEGIKKKISELKYPLYFLDFETDNPAIPRYDGMSPYQHFPFQYSCHKMNEDRGLEHFEYIHLDKSDPRLPMAESLLTSIGESGSIIAYYSRFEREIVKNLALTFPKLSEELNSIAERLWDQLDIFREHYRHYAFGNSNSLKNILPVLVPEMRYEGLEVKQGDEAQLVWNNMIRFKDGPEKEKMIKDLKEYCKMDTLAMLEIHKFLLQFVH